jgi:hypothetical protein
MKQCALPQILLTYTYDLSACKDDIEICLKNANANKGRENFAN